MSRALTRAGLFPSVFDEFMKPWSDLFDNGGFMGRMLTIPAVNITEDNDSFKLSIAVPGMKKDDLNIDVQGNLLTISAEKEETSKEADEQFTRREYNYSSFSRTFTLPDEVKKDKIDAEYKDGVLWVSMPKTDEAKKQLTGRHISIK